MGFELPSETACKHLENCFSDQQTFFSIAGKDARKSSSLLPSSHRSLNNLSSPGDRILNLSQRFRGSFSTRKSCQPHQRQDDSLQRDIDRTGPTVVRVPSRRYQRRYCPDSNQDVKETVAFDADLTSSLKLVDQKLQYIANVTSSSEASKGLAWEKPDQTGLLTGRSPYHEETPRRRSSNRSRQSDNESSVSRSSRHSHHSCRSHRSQCHHRHRHRSYSRDNYSGNESETGSTSSSHRRRHRRRHRRPKSESVDQLVDSHPQWIQIQKHQQLNSLNQPYSHSNHSVIKKTQQMQSTPHLTVNEGNSPYDQQQQDSQYSNSHPLQSSSSVILDNVRNHRKQSNHSSEVVFPVNDVPPVRPSKSSKFVSQEVRRFIESSLLA